MFEYFRFVTRNPAYVTKNARGQYSVRKAMLEFRKDNIHCAWCGRLSHLEVHHIEPVSVAPEKAGDQDNMLILCRKPACHQIIGHDGDFGRRYVHNARRVCEEAKVIRTIKSVMK